MVALGDRIAMMSVALLAGCVATTFAQTESSPNIESTPIYEEGGSQVAFSSDGRFLSVASSARDEDIVVWSRSKRGWQLHAKMKGRGAFDPNLVFSPDGKLLASATGSASRGGVVLWDVATGNPSSAASPSALQERGEIRPYYGVAFAPDGKYGGLQSQSQSAGGCFSKKTSAGVL